MVNLTVKLKNGLKVGETFHKEVEIRPLKVGDSFIANEQSEKLFTLPNGQRVVEQSANIAGKIILLRRIVKFGSLDMPITEKEIGELEYNDYEYLLSKISEYDRALFRAYSKEETLAEEEKQPSGKVGTETLGRNS